MTWDGRQSVSMVYLFSLADVCPRSLLSGLTNIYRVVSVSSPCLVIVCLEVFLFASITKEIIGRFCVFRKFVLVRLLAGAINEILSA